MNITRRLFLAGAAATTATLQATPTPAAFTPVTPISPVNQPLPTITTTIGVAGPFTGKDQNLGEQLANGARQAIDEANQLRGSFDRLFALRTLDDQNLAAEAVVTAQFAVDDPSIICVIGHLSGRVTEEALRTYVNAQMPLVIPASSYDRLTSYGYGGILRIPTKDSTEGQLSAAYVTSSRKPQSVSVLFQDGDYGFDVANGFISQLGSDKIPYRSVKFSWEKPDFDDAVARALKTDPDLIYLAGSVADMGAILPALRTAKYTGSIAASQGFFSAISTDTYATAAEGLIVSSSIPPFQFAPTDERVIQDFQQNYGTFTPLAALGYAATQIAIEATRRTGANNRLALWRSLQTPSSYDTVLGTFSFLSNGDQVEPNVYFYQVKSGKWNYLQASHTTNFLLR